MKVKNKILGFVLGTLMLVSCDKTPMFEKTFTFENQTWVQNVKPSFVVNIQNIEKEYDFVLTLRTTTDYKYSNLWIYLNTITPDGNKAREPFEIIITNPDGSWSGKKTGTIVENSLVFKRRKMPLKGKYVFTVEQGITNSSIDEVLDIGLQVLEVKTP